MNKRNLLLLLCIFALVATCFISCSKECDHTFSSDWDNDAENHWHPATCEHGEIKDGLAKHSDANEDGICDVCAYAMGHKHTYAGGWESNDTHHWKTPTCSHADANEHYNLHKDENLDYVCDECSSHVHDVNPAGYCKDAACGKKVKEIDESNIDELVAAVVYQKWLVNGGHIDYDFTGRSNSGPQYVATKHDIVDYIFGKDNYTYVKTDSAATNAGVSANSSMETWYQLDGPDEAFGVVSYDGGLTFELDISDVAKLDGYYISLSTLANGNGIENALYSLYEVAIGEDATDLKIETNVDENSVIFKYNYKTAFIDEIDVAVGEDAGEKIYNVNHFEVTVAFTYDDNYALTELVIVCDCYTNDPGSISVGGGYEILHDDVDLLYDPETDSFIFVKYDHETKTYLPTDERTPDTYTITVTQTVGERNAKNENSKTKFIPDSFDLFLDMDENYNVFNKYDGSVITGKLRDPINFYVGNYSPEGTSLHYVADQVSFKLFHNDVEIEDPENYTNTKAVAMFSFAGSVRNFFLVPKTDGAFRLEIYFMGEKTHEVTVHVGVVDDKYIDLNANEFAVKITEAYEWANEVSFTATESGTYYFNLPAGIGFIDADGYDAAELTPATDDAPAPYYDYNEHRNEDGTFVPGSFSLTLEAGQTVRFYVMSNQRGTYVISFFKI